MAFDSLEVEAPRRREGRPPRSAAPLGAETPPSGDARDAPLDMEAALRKIEAIEDLLEREGAIESLKKRSGLAKKVIGDELKKRQKRREKEERAAAAAEIQEKRERNKAYHEYFVGADGGMYRRKMGPSGDLDCELLANFSAKIERQTYVDDGCNRPASRYELLATYEKRDFSLQVSADEFPDLRWARQLPAAATVRPGRGALDHAQCAIRALSRDIPEVTAYAHTGWRRIDGEWRFLHAGGAIGADGAVSGARPELPPEFPQLKLYALPDPPDGRAAIEADRASLALLDLARDEITFPLYLSMFRAPFGHAPFSAFIEGKTQTFKSSFGAVHLSHFGAGFTEKNLPTLWKETSAPAFFNLMFFLKDMPLIGDDFKPSGTSAQIAALHEKAETVLRAQANGVGPAKSFSDGRPRPARPPRGSFISTGEMLPLGQSLAGRLLITHMRQGDVDPARLDDAQTQAAGGAYAQAMAAFLRWIARRGYERTMREFREAVREGRASCKSGGEAGPRFRVDDMMRELLAAFSFRLDFSAELGSIAAAEKAALMRRAEAALAKAAAAQAEVQRESDPVERYGGLLRDVILSGAAHIADRDGGCPDKDNPAAWGWRRDEATKAPRPQGPCIGYTDLPDDGDDIFLLPGPAFDAAKRASRAEGDEFSAAERTMRRRLCDGGLLKTMEADRGKKTVRRRICGQRPDLLHVARDLIFPDDDDGAPPRPPSGQNGPKPNGPGAETGPASEPDNHFEKLEENPPWGQLGQGGRTTQTIPHAESGKNRAAKNQEPDADAIVDEWRRNIDAFQPHSVGDRRLQAAARDFCLGPYAPIAARQGWSAGALFGRGVVDRIPRVGLALAIFPKRLGVRSMERDAAAIGSSGGPPRTFERARVAMLRPFWKAAP